RGDVEMRGEVKLPQSVDLHHTLSTGHTFFGKAPEVARTLDVPLSPQSTQNVNKVVFWKRSSTDDLIGISLYKEVLVFFAQLVKGVQDVFVVDGLSNGHVSLHPADDAPPWCQEERN